MPQASNVIKHTRDLSWVQLGSGTVSKKGFKYDSSLDLVGFDQKDGASKGK